MMAGEEGVDAGQGGGPGEDVPDWRGGGGGYWRERRTLVKSWYGYGALTEEEETGTPASHTNLLSSKERLKWRSSGALGTLLGRWSRSRNDVMGRPGGSGVQPQPMRKCHTVLALAASPSEPIRPVNRLRNTQQNIVCSRCSSLLSMASSSRYSISTEGNYVQVGGRLQKPQSQPCLEEEEQPLPTLLCKLCLTNVSSPNTWSLHQCGCTFCTQCMSAYVEFEIGQGAYEISCPDAMCQTQGVVTLPEIENLVSSEVVEKHRRFRHNREVERDVRLAWCPSVGCETVCNVSAVEGVKTGGVSNVAVCVHCPTCDLDFCSVCRGRWHGGNHCPTAASLPPVPGISFDSDLIKCCPMCAVPIEKDEGCAQMMCKQCKHVFCWYCLASLDDDFLLRHYDKGPCKNKLGHSRASVIWHRTQVIGIFAGFGILLLVASPLLLLAAPCIVCCKCRVCSDGPKLDSDDDIPEESAS